MTTPVKVWDLAVRVFHWSLVVSFVLAYITAEENETLHVYLGYTIAGLILFRFFWGFVGSRYARFSAFLYSPSETLAYVRDSRRGRPPHYLSHNPLGALMVFALLLALSGTVITGLALNGDLPGVSASEPERDSAMAVRQTATSHEQNRGEEMDDHESGEQGRNNQHELWEEWHEGFVNFTLVLIALHITGVIVASRQHKENLVRAMITGWKKQG